MKQCPKCGKTYQDDDIFCEACGIRLPEQPAKGKSPVPIIVGCVAAAAVLIGGTVLGVTMLTKNKLEQSEQMTSQVAEADPGQEKPAAESEKREKRIPASGQEEDLSSEPAAAEAHSEEIQEEVGAEKVAESQQEEVPAQASEGGQEGFGIGKVIEDQPEAAPAYETCYVVNCQESITLRKKPSTSAGEYCQIPLGAAVSFVEEASNGFYKIVYNGQEGYALASYLSFNAQNEPDEAILMEVVNCQKSITLRKTPSTGADEFCQIPLGELVEFLGTAENGFYLVSYNGYTGYALASYLTKW